MFKSHYWALPMFGPKVPYVFNMFWAHLRVPLLGFNVLDENTHPSPIKSLVLCLFML